LIKTLSDTSRGRVLDFKSARGSVGLEDLQDDEHLRATSFFTAVDDPAMGRLRFPGVPVLIDGQRLPVRMPPRLGQHTAEVLASIGMAGTAQNSNAAAPSTTTAAL